MHICVCMSVWNEVKLSRFTLERDARLPKVEDDGRKNTVSSLNERRNKGLEV